MKTKQVKKGTIEPIKTFQTLDEEAAFWDTHSALDEINEGTVVAFHQVNKTDTLTIRFAHEDIQRLREEAVEQGVGQAPSPGCWSRRVCGRSSALCVQVDFKKASSEDDYLRKWFFMYL